MDSPASQSPPSNSQLASTQQPPLPSLWGVLLQVLVFAPVGMASLVLWLQQRSRSNNPRSQRLYRFFWGGWVLYVVLQGAVLAVVVYLGGRLSPVLASFY